MIGRPALPWLDGADALVELDAAWDAAVDAMTSAGCLDVFDLCVRRTAMLLDHRPTLDAVTDDDRRVLSAWPTHGSFGARERAALAFTEQYLLDVASISDEQVVELGDGIGSEFVVDFVNALLVVEQRLRLDLGLGRVLAGSIAGGQS
ncbi:MAG: hypothetical protein AAGD33_07450 [Actinomycetota bacterium]